MANKLKKGITGTGEIFFAHVLKPEEYQGKSTNKFSLMLKLAEKDKQKLLAEVDAEWNKFMESEEGRRHKYNTSTLTVSNSTRMMSSSNSR